jgi:hypothetical protein
MILHAVTGRAMCAAAFAGIPPAIMDVYKPALRSCSRCPPWPSRSSARCCQPTGRHEPKPPQPCAPNNGPDRPARGPPVFPMGPAGVTSVLHALATGADRHPPAWAATSRPTLWPPLCRRIVFGRCNPRRVNLPRSTRGKDETMSEERQPQKMTDWAGLFLEPGEAIRAAAWGPRANSGTC